MKCISFTDFFIFDFLLREWDKELERKASALKSEKHYNPSLTKAILRAFGFKFSLLGFFVIRWWMAYLIHNQQPLRKRHLFEDQNI